MYTLWINVIIGSLVQRLACISIHCSWSNFQILVWGSKSHLELTRNCYVVYILNTNFIHIKLVTLMVYLFGIIKLTSGLTFLHSFSFSSCSLRRKHVTSLFLHNKWFSLQLPGMSEWKGCVRKAWLLLILVNWITVFVVLISCQMSKCRFVYFVETCGWFYIWEYLLK